MIGHIGSLKSVSPTAAEASGIGLNVAESRIKFKFVSNEVPSTVCVEANTSTTTGCFQTKCVWSDPAIKMESDVTKSSEALRSSSDVLSCPFTVWPHASWQTQLSACVETDTRFDLANSSVMGEPEYYCILWDSGKQHTEFNITEVWTGISRSSVSALGGEVVIVSGSGFDTRVLLDTNVSAYRVKLVSGRFTFLSNAYPSQR